jgi:hypothetical protein
VALVTVLGVVTFLVVVAAASSGLGGVLIFLGLSLLLLGIGAVIVGRARWAFVHGRGVGALAAVAGLTLLVAGTTTIPTPDDRVATASAAQDEGAEDDPAPSASAEPPRAGTTEAGASPSASRVGSASASPSAPRSSSASRSPSASPSAPEADAALADAASEGTALALLDDLVVKGRAPRTGYDRDLFGSGWGDTDRNGCDTRNDILARDLTDIAIQAGTNGCVVVTGTLADPFSGEPISFARGDDTSTLVQIDHVVALSDAWQKGAQQWEPRKRLAFGNDPLNLLAVDGPLNAQKGDGDTATWLPPNRPYRCAYVARQVAVKAKYEVWVGAAERDAMARVLATCPDEPAPTSSAPTISPVQGNVATTASSRPPRAAAPTPTPTAAEPDPEEPATSYANCDAVRAAGKAPLLRGEPGYSGHLDRDDDGVACETSASAPEPAPTPSPSSSATDPRFGTCKEAKANGYGPYVRGQDPEYDWYRDGDSDGDVCE